MANDTIPGFTPIPLPTDNTSSNSATGRPLAPPGLATYDPKTKKYTLTPIGIQSGVQPGPPQGDATHQTPFDAGTVSTTQFGTGVNSTAYTASDAWNVPLEQVPSIKAALVQAGLLPAKDYGTGAWDFNSASAYTKVLEFANTYGLTATDAMSYFIANPVPVKGTGGTQPIISYANPVDVQTGYQNVSQALTGQEQDPAAFQQAYTAEEAASQHVRGQNYTQAPSITSAATQYVQHNLAGQELAYGAAAREQEFLHMVGQ